VNSGELRQLFAKLELAYLSLWMEALLQVRIAVMCDQGDQDPGCPWTSSIFWSSFTFFHILKWVDGDEVNYFL
jgi:hypothetical protein